MMGVGMRMVGEAGDLERDVLLSVCKGGREEI